MCRSTNGSTASRSARLWWSVKVRLPVDDGSFGRLPLCRRRCRMLQSCLTRTVLAPERFRGGFAPSALRTRPVVHQAKTLPRGIVGDEKSTSCSLSSLASTNCEVQRRPSQEAKRSSGHPLSATSRCHNAPSIVAASTSRHSVSLTASCPVAAAASAYLVHASSRPPSHSASIAAAAGSLAAAPCRAARRGAMRRNTAVTTTACWSKRVARSGSASTARVSGRSSRRTSSSSPRKLTYQTWRNSVRLFRNAA